MDSDVFLAWPLFCIDTLVDVHHHHHHHHCLIILMEMCAIRKTSVTDLARLENLLLGMMRVKSIKYLGGP